MSLHSFFFSCVLIHRVILWQRLSPVVVMVMAITRNHLVFVFCLCVGYPPQGYPPQGYPPQGYPPQGYPPQGYEQQGYAPYPPQQQGYPPQQQQQQNNGPSFMEGW